ncbi:MAG: ParA family protein, partial [Magnetospirillum sp.]|nr:ParA family protein [Magnetospirillum sp.]
STPAEVDVVVVDCPPAFGILSVNACVAADVIILPVVPAPLALDGLHKAWWNIQRVRNHFNRDLDTMGILFTMTEGSDVMNRIIEAVSASFGARVLPVQVPRDLKVVEAAARDLPLVILDPESPAAVAYLKLAETVESRMLGVAVPEGAEARAEELLHRWREPRPDTDDPDALPPVRESPPMEAGPVPGRNWDDELTEEVDDLPEMGDLRWKIGVAVMLIALGACLGYVFGRWMYMPV